MAIKFIIGGLGLSGKMFPKRTFIGLIEESSFSNQPWLYARWIGSRSLLAVRDAGWA